MSTLRSFIAASALMLTACGQVETAAPTRSDPGARDYAAEIVNASGDIALPKDFDRWPTLGTWATASGGDGAPVDEWHAVYVSPGGIDSHVQNGVFEDGAVLVKEVRGAKPSLLTTGAAHWPTDPVVWFVMVKDSTDSRADHPLWADGWGWALYNAPDRMTQTATSYEEACQGCHIPATDTDFIYSEAYPVLRKGGGTPSPAWAAQ